VREREREREGEGFNLKSSREDRRERERDRKAASAIYCQKIDPKNQSVQLKYQLPTHLGKKWSRRPAGSGFTKYVTEKFKCQYQTFAVS
jgi:hypothetical protein